MVALSGPAGPPPPHPLHTQISPSQTVSRDDDDEYSHFFLHGVDTAHAIDTHSRDNWWRRLDYVGLWQTTVNERLNELFPLSAVFSRIIFRWGCETLVSNYTPGLRTFSDERKPLQATGHNNGLITNAVHFTSNTYRQRQRVIVLSALRTYSDLSIDRRIRVDRW
jgi:hypothetical protein